MSYDDWFYTAIAIVLSIGLVFIGFIAGCEIGYRKATKEKDAYYHPQTGVIVYYKKGEQPNE